MAHTVKLTLPNGECRRFRFEPHHLDITAFRQTVVEADAALASQTFSITWQGTWRAPVGRCMGTTPGPGLHH
jgi:hypothetical protein